MQKIAYKQKIISSFGETKDPKTFWSLINYYRNVNKTKKDSLNLDIWLDYFMRIYSESTISVNYDILRVENLIMDAEIKVEEIIYSNDRCKRGKSPGENGICNEFYKNLPGN